MSCHAHFFTVWATREAHLSDSSLELLQFPVCFVFSRASEHLLTLVLLPEMLSVFLLLLIRERPLRHLTITPETLLDPQVGMCAPSVLLCVHPASHISIWYWSHVPASLSQFWVIVHSCHSFTIHPPAPDTGSWKEFNTYVLSWTEDGFLNLPESGRSPGSRLLCPSCWVSSSVAHSRVPPWELPSLRWSSPKLLPD